MESKSKLKEPLFERQLEPFIDVDICFKLILVGDSGSGKTCIIKRLAYNEFEESSSVTIGGDFVNIYYKSNDTKIKVQLWDTCGLEQYISLTRLYFKGTDAAILTYETQKPFDSRTRMWHEEIKANTTKDIPIFLVGAKCDLGVKENLKIKDFIEEFKITNSFITSSRTNINIEIMMTEILKTLFLTYSKRIDEKRKRFSIKLKEKKKKNKCCN